MGYDDSNLKVAVICNCYNGASYLKEAIESVLSQTYKNFEFLLIDNFSTDETKNIFKSFPDQRLKYYKTKSHLKLGDARNYALQFVNSDYISFIDADDIWIEDKLSKQINFMHIQNVKFSYSQANIFYEDGRQNFYSKKINNQLLNSNELSIDYDVCFSSLIFEAKLLDKNKLFNSSLELTEDADFIFKIMLNNNIGYLSEPLVYYRSSDKSNSWTKPNSFISDLDIMREDYKNIGLKTKILDPLYRTAYWVNALSNWKKGKNNLAYRFLFKIKKWQLRHYICLFLIIFPYNLIRPFFKIFNKKVL